MNAAYEKCIGEYGSYYYRVIKPTGRWKLETGPYGKNVMYIERKGWILRWWVHESNVVFLPKMSEQVFECGGGV